MARSVSIIYTVSMRREDPVPDAIVKTELRNKCAITEYVAANDALDSSAAFRTRTTRSSYMIRACVL